MDNKYINISRGVGFLDILLLVNIVLKLVGVINWSWWVVLWPLWASLIIIVFVIFVICLILGRN